MAKPNHSFYGPRSRENSRLLLESARALGLHPRVIRTMANGYYVPDEIVDYINKDLEIVDVTESQDQETVTKHEEQDSEGKVALTRPSTADPKADWLAYAQSLGLDVTDDNTKAEIVEAVKAKEETD